MNESEIKAIAAYFVGYCTLANVVVFGIYFAARSFFAPYFGKKGENLATKEDIEGITRQIKAIETEYALIIESNKAHQQMRMAALDRRLQAHQEAFTLWRELMMVTHTEKVGEAVVKCQDWWEKNCLYLEPEIRSSFVEAYSAAGSHATYLRARATPEIIRDNWKQITRFPDILFEAVQLPPLTQSEKETLIPENADPA